ncbi:MAG: hypothetical protein ACOCR0_00775 [Haloferacaceae archaeon]
MGLRRWTPLTMLAPRRYVDRSDFWTEFDLQEWSVSDYEWTRDPWNGYRDFAKRPVETISEDEGDCEDYALVAISWAIARDRPGVGIGFCWELPYPWPRHVIAFDEEYVYSSGDIVDESVEEYLERSVYDSILRRPVW